MRRIVVSGRRKWSAPRVKRGFQTVYRKHPPDNRASGCLGCDGVRAGVRAEMELRDGAVPDLESARFRSVQLCICPLDATVVGLYEEEDGQSGEKATDRRSRYIDQSRADTHEELHVDLDGGAVAHQQYSYVLARFFNHPRRRSENFIVQEVEQARHENIARLAGRDVCIGVLRPVGGTLEGSQVLRRGRLSSAHAQVECLCYQSVTFSRPRASSFAVIALGWPARMISAVLLARLRSLDQHASNATSARAS